MSTGASEGGEQGASQYQNAAPAAASDSAFVSAASVSPQQLLKIGLRLICSTATLLLSAAALLLKQRFYLSLAF